MLQLVPSEVTVTVNKGWPFRVVGATGTVSWSAQAGSVESNGTFHAPGSAGDVTVTARDGQRTATAQVHVVGHGISILAGTQAGPGRENGDALTQARLNRPIGLAVAGGAVFVADSSNHAIRQLQASGMVRTVAGVPGNSGSVDGVGANARFDGPYGLAMRGMDLVISERFGDTLRLMDPDGQVTRLAGAHNTEEWVDGPLATARFHAPLGLVSTGGALLVADRSNQCIRRVTTDQVTTWGGAGGMAGNANGTLAEARFDRPHDLAVDGNGNIYIADTRNHLVRRVAMDGTVSTWAGSGTEGHRDGVAAQARFSKPHGLAWHPATGDLYVADTGNRLIRRITPAGVVITAAGVPFFTGARDGPAAQALFDDPIGLAVADDGRLLISEMSAHTIRALDITTDTVTTLAGRSGIGMADGPARAPHFQRPRGLLATQDGSVYVADSYNVTIRRVSSTGEVTTVAGASLQPGHVDGPALNARFRGPWGLAEDPAGNLYVSDTHNHVLRVISPEGMVRTLCGLPYTVGYLEGPDSLFNRPRGVAWVGTGVVVADGGNHVIRAVTTDGMTSLLAGLPGQEGHRDGAVAQALFDTPHGLAVAPDGTIYVADQKNRVVRAIARGMVSTVAGVPGTEGQRDGDADQALFAGPTGLALGPDGSLYVADNWGRTVRKISGGQVTTVAGAGYAAALVEGALPGTLGQPLGIAITPGGDLVVADRAAHAVVMVRMP